MRTVRTEFRAPVLQAASGEVQLARDGEGPPVLVSHGGPGGFDLGVAWCRHLREGGCELLAPSRPGYLRTPPESGRSPAAQADLYAAMLDALEIERVTMLGFSAGGPAAVHFAARHPDRRSCRRLRRLREDTLRAVSSGLVREAARLGSLLRGAAFDVTGRRVWSR